MSPTTNTASEELFRRLVASVRDYAIFMLDPNGYVSTWNIGAERIKGYRAGEIIGKHFSAFYPEGSGREAKCAFELAAAARHGSFEDEGFRVRKDGSRFWANVVITAVRDQSGGVVGFAKVTRDLTERKRAEQAHAARIAAEQANRTKDEFLAMLGHELRNPLAPILTALQLMKLRGGGATSKEQHIIERQVRHLMRLVDDLLDVARIAHGAIALDRKSLDLRDVIASALEAASPALEQRRHDLVLDLPRSVLGVNADEARLVQVFVNLLVNAAKYTGPGGRIELHARASGADAVIEVRDDGIGIEPELLARVFDPFTQGEQGVDRSSGGLGLGLALVRKLVTLHGGSVEARSQGRGSGSTFMVRLPLAVSASQYESSDTVWIARGKSAKGRRVLVVDDNEDALTLLAEMLTLAGHDVKVATDAAIALEIVKTFAPEVAIIDIGLPVMDGYALASRLRAELASAPPRLIAVSGYGQARDIERSKKAGFDLHLVKPVDAQCLAENVAGLEPEIGNLESCSVD